MPAINQLVREVEKDCQHYEVIGSSKESSKAWGLYSCIPPSQKKPNSALRKVARVRLTNKLEVTAAFLVRGTIFRSTTPY